MSKCNWQSIPSTWQFEIALENGSCDGCEMLSGNYVLQYVESQIWGYESLGLLIAFEIIGRFANPQATLVITVLPCDVTFYYSLEIAEEDPVYVSCCSENTLAMSYCEHTGDEWRPDSITFDTTPASDNCSCAPVWGGITLLPANENEYRSTVIDDWICGSNPGVQYVLRVVADTATLTLENYPDGGAWSTWTADVSSWNWASPLVVDLFSNVSGCFGKVVSAYIRKERRRLRMHARYA